MSAMAAPELGHAFGLTPVDFALRNRSFVHVLIGVHEAGHAALADGLGYAVTGVEVFPTETGHSGRTHIAAPAMLADDAVLFALAGPAAEFLWMRQMPDHGLDEALFSQLTTAAISPDDQRLLDTSLALSSFRDLQDGFAAACRWVERHAEAVHHRADMLRAQCACLPTRACA